MRFQLQTPRKFQWCRRQLNLLWKLNLQRSHCAVALWHRGDGAETAWYFSLKTQNAGDRGLVSDNVCKLKWALKIAKASETMETELGKIPPPAVSSHSGGEIYRRFTSRLCPPSPLQLPAGGCCYVSALCSPAAQLWINPCWLFRDHMAFSLRPALPLQDSAMVSTGLLLLLLLPLPPATPKKEGWACRCLNTSGVFTNTIFHFSFTKRVKCCDHFFLASWQMIDNCIFFYLFELLTVYIYFILHD